MITQLNISQEFINEEIEDVDKGRIDMVLEIDLPVEKEVCITVAEMEGTIRMAIIMVTEVTDPEMIIKHIIGIVIGLIIERKISTKIMAKGIGTEVENMIGLGPGIEALQEIIQEIGIEITKVGEETEDKGLEQIQETEGIDQGQDLAPILAQKGTGQDAIGAMNMTTLQENALTLCQDAVMQLFAQEEQAEALNYFESDLN